MPTSSTSMWASTPRWRKKRGNGPYAMPETGRRLQAPLRSTLQSGPTTTTSSAPASPHGPPTLCIVGFNANPSGEAIAGRGRSAHSPSPPSVTSCDHEDENQTDDVATRGLSDKCPPAGRAIDHPRLARRSRNESVSGRRACPGVVEPCAGQSFRRRLRKGRTLWSGARAPRPAEPCRCGARQG